MISALEAVIAYYNQLPSMGSQVGEQIASRHQYGDGWALTSKALTVKYSGGVPELYVPDQRVRFDVRCYGPSAFGADQVYREVVAASRNFVRTTVITVSGLALIYALNIDSGPSALRDPDVDMDLILVFVEALVAEQDIS